MAAAQKSAAYCSFLKPPLLFSLLVPVLYPQSQFSCKSSRKASSTHSQTSHRHADSQSANTKYNTLRQYNNTVQQYSMLNQRTSRPSAFKNPLKVSAGISQDVLDLTHARHCHQQLLFSFLEHLLESPILHLELLMILSFKPRLSRSLLHRL